MLEDRQSEGRLTVQLTEVILGVVVSRPVSKRFFTLVTGTRQQEQKRCDFSMFSYLNSSSVCWRNVATSLIFKTGRDLAAAATHLQLISVKNLSRMSAKHNELIWHNSEVHSC